MKKWILEFPVLRTKKEEPRRCHWELTVRVVGENKLTSPKTVGD